MGNARSNYTDEEWERLTEDMSKPKELDIALVIINERVKELVAEMDVINTKLIELAKELGVSYDSIHIKTD